jgi:hypothetical protein
LPAAANGQQADPPSDTPAGKTYEIPVERARDDAKPLGGDAAERSSRYRSDNNFGSSSQVPGVEVRDDDQTAAAGTAGGGSSGGGSSGGDSGGTDGGNSGAPTALQASSGRDDPSRLGLFALLGAIVLAAILAGAAAARARRSSS